jgi:hypothetical protein
MFYWLIDLSNTVPGLGAFRTFLNVFRYITFRTGGAMVTGALFVFLFGPWIIDHLRLRQGKGQPIRTDGPQSHLITKKGTPTMGGLMILSGVVVSTVLWANPLNPYIWIVLAVTLGFGFVGFYDDYLKVTKQTHSGFAGRIRLAIEAVIALAACYALVRLGRDPFSTSLVIPFFKDVVLNFGWFFVIFGAFIIVGAGNVRLDRLSRGERGILGLSADQLRRRYRRTRSAVRRGAGRGIGIPVVQRAAGIDLHGRHRFARARRHARLDRGRGQARDRAGGDRRIVRAGSGLGDRAGGLVQAHRQAHLPDGPDPSSFRATGLDRAADRDPVLDHLGDAGAGRPLHLEAAVMCWIFSVAPEWRAES